MSTVEEKNPEAGSPTLKNAAANGKGTYLRSNLSRAFSHYIPLYLIVVTLLFIALPKNVSTAIVASLTGTPIVQLPSIPGANVNQVATPGVNAPPVSQPSLSTAQQSAADRNVVDIAKMTIDSSKDKYDSIKDMYDKLFSVIAAMAALIAFLGFKGVDSFLSAKQKADETVARAEEAQRKAEQSLDEVQDFINRRYPADNRAELNVVTGIVMRYIADSYKTIFEVLKPEHKIDEDEMFLKCVDRGIYYLSAVENLQGVDKSVLRRAIITKGNLFRRRGEVETAISLLEQLADKYGVEDEVAVYNVACYACLVAKKYACAGNNAMAERYIQKAIGSLKKAIELSEEGKDDAKTDPDFAWFRDTSHQGYLALVA
ncbi:hypothetical protein LBW62_19560 [Ralstonia solanacearum]|uniref:hypothetical protein n=1 Tax=Ralstonia solanacearum TaxID=305 RepID=UPI0012D3A968|nr:hypothetical protein [Ralstonia solanacearum]MBB6590183.1 hypothetical protein [Ralstonia solanacearum]MDB0543432.1 hypothetical protein [Ralstonia solanacearum]MDB0558383.1 hypothetical protein [Ralstonia solanacearum]